MLVCLKTEKSIKKKKDPTSQACKKLKGVKKGRLISILTAAGGDKHRKEVCNVKKRLDFICGDLEGPFWQRDQDVF